jgi:tetratricopeptide (TPR) repeat protein
MRNLRMHDLFCLASRLGLLLALGVGGTWASATTASSDATVECRSLAAQVTSNRVGGPGERARVLESHSGRCAGTGVYDSAVASSYEQAGMYDDADRAARRGLTVTNGYRANLLSILALTQLKRGNDEKAYEMTQEVVRQYPRYGLAYSLLSQIDATRGRWDKAHANAKKFAELDSSAMSFIVLATTQYQLKRYTEVVASVAQAMKIDPGRIGSATGLTEGIYALMLLERRDEAKELLLRHMQANPMWRESLPMLRAARELGLVGQ